jgi:hypothetical protein
MSTLRWRPIAEKPTDERDMTAMIRCHDEHDTYLLPGPVRWDAGEWTDEGTGRAIPYQPDTEYHWCPEADIIL